MVAVYCKPSEKLVELKRFPVDGPEGFDLGIHQYHSIYFDEEVSKDGKGSLKIYPGFPHTEKAQSIKIVHSGDIDVQNARLIYRAEILRSEDFFGTTHLAMIVHYPDNTTDYVFPIGFFLAYRVPFKMRWKTSSAAPAKAAALNLRNNI